MEEQTDKNEFENIGPSGDEAPEATISAMPDSPIVTGESGQKYDFNNAPETTRGPPRVDLDGKEFTLLKADIILPPESQPWIMARSGKSEYKNCKFIMFYDFEGQVEYYSGVRVFKREIDTPDGRKIGYSHPTIQREMLARHTQATKLINTYAGFKKKNVNEVSLKEFMSYLNSQPKIKIAAEEFNNPETNEPIKKNMIGNFL